jgi:hypothetical protein
MTHCVKTICLFGIPIYGWYNLPQVEILIKHCVPLDQERIVVLDSLKPESLAAICEQLSTQVAQLEHELEQASRQLETTHDVELRHELEQKQSARSREIELLRARLDTYCSAHYHEDDETMRKRALRVA